MTNKRRKRSELKELLLRSGLELMSDRTRPIEADGLNYKSVFDKLESTHGIRVTHASVHERIWPSQRSFQLDVLRTAAESLPGDTFLDGAGAAVAVLDTADLSTTDGRRRATRELIRVSCNADMESPDITLSVYRSIRSALAGLPDDHPEHGRTELVIEETRASLADRYVALFRRLVSRLELRTRPDLGIDLDSALLLLFTQVVALADGFRIDASAANTMMLPTGPGESQQLWHLYSWSVWSSARSLLELDGELSDDQRAL